MDSKIVEKLIKHRRFVAVAIVVIIILIIIVAVVYMEDERVNSAKLDILVTPESARVLINGEEYQNGEYKIQPGRVYVEVSKEGFISQEEEFVAEAGETVKVWIYLVPEEEGWYERNEGDERILEAVTDYLQSQAINRFYRENVILESLPIEIEYFTKDYSKYVKYTISYRMKEEVGSFVIVIHDYTGGNYEDALDKIRARGFLPEDYEIEYSEEIENTGKASD